MSSFSALKVIIEWNAVNTVKGEILPQDLKYYLKQNICFSSTSNNGTNIIFCWIKNPDQIICLCLKLNNA